MVRVWGAKLRQSCVSSIWSFLAAVRQGRYISSDMRSLLDWPIAVLQCKMLAYDVRVVLRMTGTPDKRLRKIAKVFQRSMTCVGNFLTKRSEMSWTPKLIEVRRKCCASFDSRFCAVCSSKLCHFIKFTIPFERPIKTFSRYGICKILR